MSIKDFQVKQLRASKLIVSRSHNQVPGFMIYSASSDGVDYAGGVAGSVLVGVGTDVFMFVSGSASTGSDGGAYKRSKKDVTLFGGDVVVSGTLYAERQVMEVDGNISGSLHVSGSAKISGDAEIDGNTQLDGTLTVSSLGVGKDVTIYGEDSNAIGVQWDASGEEHGSLTLGQDDHGVDFQVYGETADHMLFWDQSQDKLILAGEVQHTRGNVVFNETGHAIDFRVESDTNDHAFFVDGSTDQVLVLTAAYGGTDVNFFVSGTKGSKGTAIRGTSVFNGDLHVSGNLSVEGVSPGGASAVGWATGSAGFVDGGGIKPGWISTTGSLAVTGSVYVGKMISPLYVGDGTANSAVTIDADGANSGSLIFIKDTGAQAAMLSLEGDENLVLINSGSNKDIHIKANDGGDIYTAISIDSSAKWVGINTDDPGYDLHISGTDSSTILTVETDNSSVGQYASVLLKTNQGESGGNHPLSSFSLLYTGSTSGYYNKIYNEPGNASFTGHVNLRYGQGTDGDYHSLDYHILDAQRWSTDFVQPMFSVVSGTLGSAGKNTGPGGQVLVMSGANAGSTAGSSDPQTWKDTNFFVSGTVGGKNSTTHRGTSVFGGDLHVSGNLTVEGTSPGGASAVGWATGSAGYVDGGGIKPGWISTTGSLAVTGSVYVGKMISPLTVGDGTANSAVVVDADGASSGSIIFVKDTGAAGAVISLEADENLIIINSGSNKDIAFKSNSASGGLYDALYVDSSTRRLGIKTSNPTYDLHLSGTSSTNTLAVTSNGRVQSSATIQVQASTTHGGVTQDVRGLWQIVTGSQSNSFANVRNEEGGTKFTGLTLQPAAWDPESNYLGLDTHLGFYQGETLYSGIAIVSGTVGSNRKNKGPGTQVLIMSGAGPGDTAVGLDPQSFLDTNFFVSGSIGNRNSTARRGTSVFGGDSVVSGSLVVLNSGKTGATISGSIHHTVEGKSFLIAGTGITVSSGTNGQITISASGGAGGTITVKSGSNTYSSTDTIDFSKLGLIQNLGSGDLAITGTIGDAEEGTYTDGLFSTFASNTPIGTAIDKINEVLKYLAPEEAPALDNINSFSSVASGSAYLTFGSTNNLSSASPAYATVAGSAGIASGTNENGLYVVHTSSNNIRMGVFAGGTTVSFGLNSDVAIAKYAATKYINYVSGAFGSADQGTLGLELNGTSFVTVDLTNAAVGTGQPGTGSASHTSGGGSGFIHLSQTGSAVQSDGNSFGLFQNRTGLVRVKPGDMRNGWNYARVTHTIGTSTTTTNYVEWLIDASGSALSVAGNGWAGLHHGYGQKRLSGIKYGIHPTGSYRVRISNYYQYVYDRGNAITFGSSHTGTGSIAIPSQVTKATSAAAGWHNKVLHLSASVTGTTGLLLLGDTMTANVSLAHPLKSNLSNAGSATTGRWLIYSTSINGTALFEDFETEINTTLYGRLVSGTDASYNSQASIGMASGNYWNSFLHMSGGNSQGNGLMYYSGTLRSPKNAPNGGDFRSAGDGGSYYGAGLSWDSNPNYSGVTGNRTWYRPFMNATGKDARDFDITIKGTGATIVPYSTDIDSSATNIKVLAKVPGTCSFVDLGAAFSYNTASLYAGGRLNNSLNASLSESGVTNQFTFGTGSFAHGEGVIVYVIADAAWTGHISSVLVNIPAVGVTAVTESPNLDNVSTADTGVSGKITWDSGHAVGSYTPVGTAAGFTAVTTNGAYLNNATNGNNLRKGIFNGATVINGVLNDDVTASGNSYSANSFGNAFSGSLALQVNGVNIHTVNLDNWGGGSSLNGNSSGFVSVSAATVGKDTDSLADFRRWWRTGQYQIAAADQRDGWNYMRVVHTQSLTNPSSNNIVTSNFIEWVNDTDSNSIGVDTPAYSTYFESNNNVDAGDEYYYQSGVKYFIQPTGSARFRLTNAYTNTYSNSSSGLGFTSLSNLSVTNIYVTGSGLSSNATAAAASMGYPNIDNSTAGSELQVISVTGSMTFGQSESLPGTSGSTSYSSSWVGFGLHPLNSTASTSAQTKTNWLVFSGAVGSSNINTEERFGREDFRLQSGSYANQSATGSGEWNSQTSLGGGDAGHNTGMLIYNAHLMAPGCSGTLGSGDFRDTSEGGSLTSPKSNVNYSALTTGAGASNDRRDYYRAFLNNTTNDQASVVLTVYGSATLVPRSGAGTAALGANKNVYIDVKIPGKTGWMDTAKAASGGTDNGDGALAGDRDSAIDGSGASNTADFQTAFVAGTVSSGGPEHFIIRIVASKYWTGYISRVSLSW